MNACFQQRLCFTEKLHLMFQINELKAGDEVGVGGWKGRRMAKMMGKSLGCRSGCLLSPEKIPDSATQTH